MLSRLEQEPEGFVAKNVARYGMEGLLDMYDAAEGRAISVDLRHSPFCNDSELKSLVAEARTTQHELARAVWERLFND